MTSEPGSFARATIVERKPEIIRRVLADHPYPPRIAAALAALAAEIASAAIGPPAASAVDTEADFWREQWAEHSGRTWLELPWYFAETYFYRRLLEAVDYFGPTPWGGRDPFGPQKRAQEAEAIAQVGEVWPQISGTVPEARLAMLLHACLWGNRADLSNYTVRERAVGASAADRDHILIDHTEAVRRLLRQGAGRPSLPDAAALTGGPAAAGGPVPTGRPVPTGEPVPTGIAFVADNVGADSLFDLALADYLLEQGWVTQATFHLKDRPFFVSDAMPSDILMMIDQLRLCPYPGLAALGRRLEDATNSGALRLTHHPFWSRSLCFEELPSTLRAQLAATVLVILKGDVNYRRLLGDRHWPHTTRMEDANTSFPRPFLAVRTFKGEIMVGLQPGEAEALACADPTWLINGKRGVIHLVGRDGSQSTDARDPHDSAGRAVN